MTAPSPPPRRHQRPALARCALWCVGLLLAGLGVGRAQPRPPCGSRGQSVVGPVVVAGDVLSVPAPSLPVSARWWVLVDGRPAATWPAARAEGRLRTPPWPATVPEGEHTLVLELQPWHLATAEDLARWPIEVVADPAAHPTVRAVAQARAAGDGAGARRLIEAGLAAATAEGAPLRAAVLRVEAARLTADAEGPAAGAAAWARNAAAAEAAYLPSEAARAWFAAAYMYLQSNALAEATAATAAGAALAERWQLCGGASTAARYAGLLASRLGQLRAAEPAFLRAEALATAEGQTALAEYARLNRSQLLSVQGRHTEALALLASVPDRPGLSGAARTVNLGWTALLAHAAGTLEAPLADIEARLAEAAATFTDLAQPARAANAWINVAYAAWLGERPEAAEAALARAAALSPARADYDTLFARLLAAQLALDAGRLEDAQARFGAVAEDADARESPEPAWRAHLGLARVAVAEDRPLAALAALDTAAEAVESRARHAHLGEAQARFVDERRDLHDLRMTLLLARGDLEGAFAAEAASQARVLRALEAEARLERLSPADRARWTARVADWLQARARFEAAADDGTLLGDAERARFLAARRAEATALTARFDAAYAVLDEGAPTAGREAVDLAALRAKLGAQGALLLFADHPSGPGRFWLDAQDLRVGPASPAPDLRALLGDDLAALADVDVLWVVAGGLAAAEELAAARLPDGTPLLSRCELRFLPTVSALLDRGRAPPTGPPVVVADPQLNLPRARTEGANVAALDPQSRVFMGEAAQHTAISAALDQARWLHFAGHGVLAPEHPWDAHLALANGQRLTLTDLLVARPRLGTVVLSGCETGRALRLSAQAAVGLPAAFLSAGANAVLATRRPIGDGEPAAVLARFWAAGGATRPGAAWRAAVLASEAVGDTAWTAFALIGAGE